MCSKQEEITGPKLSGRVNEDLRVKAEESPFCGCVCARLAEIVCKIREVIIVCKESELKMDSLVATFLRG